MDEDQRVLRELIDAANRLMTALSHGHNDEWENFQGTLEMATDYLEG